MSFPPYILNEITRLWHLLFFMKWRPIILFLKRRRRHTNVVDFLSYFVSPEQLYRSN